MKKKQLLAVVAAITIFALTGYLGVQSAISLQKARQEALELTDSLSVDWLQNLTGLGTSDKLPEEPYIGLIRIEGSIAEASDTGSYISEAGFDLEGIIAQLEGYAESESNKGLLLYINSPGGTINMSDKLYLALLDYKEATCRPVYAFFDDYACSGAYYAAMAADDICADRNSICVNIGVYISVFDLTGLFAKLGVESIAFKSSENKGIGLTGQPWTEEQKAIYQELVDLYYDQFLEVVCAGRGMTKKQVKARNDGREMLASQALVDGFIDSVGRYDDYVETVLEKTGSELLYEPSESETFLTLYDRLFGIKQQQKSDTQALLEFAEAHSGMVVMAYDQNY